MLLNASYHVAATFHTAKIFKRCGYLCVGVDGKRTEKTRCGFLIVLCQSLAKLSVVNTSAPSFLYPSEKGLV